MDRDQCLSLELRFPVLDDVALSFKEKEGEDDVHHHETDLEDQVREVEGDDEESNIHQEQ